MTADGEPEAGLGCRTLVTTLGVLLVFAVASVAMGLAIALGDDVGRLGERIGFTLYGAGAPISALFAAIAGELPLAPLTDVIVWIVAAAGTTRLTERRGIPMARSIALVIAMALVYGVVVSSFIERV